jgi:lysophospholipid acyltransferase (LPLAT)-like uncharacterized protein
MARTRDEVRNTRKAVVLGTLAGWLMRLWSSLLRVQVEVRWPSRATGDGPVIYAHWHNRILALPPTFTRVRERGRRCVVLTSASNDGAVVAAAMAVFGFGAVRGSASRRGAAALVGLVRAVRDGNDAAVTPDGPRGPRYVFHPGVIKLAQATGAPIIPVHVTYSSAWRLRTWDRFVLPKPFSRVRVVYDHPIRVPTTQNPSAFEAARQQLENHLLAGVDDR